MATKKEDSGTQYLWATMAEIPKRERQGFTVVDSSAILMQRPMKLAKRGTLAPKKKRKL